MGNTESKQIAEPTVEGNIEGEQQVSFTVHDVKPVVDIGSLPVGQASLVVRSRFLDKDKQKLVKNALSSPDMQLLTATPVNNQFVSAVVLAFDKHLELMLRPQHFWLAVTQGVAMHVETHAEALRRRLVKHQGRKVLEIDVTPKAAAGLTAADWEGFADNFTMQIQANAVESTFKHFQCGMSSTTPTERVAINMTVMDAGKSYFDYRLTTCCGFPKIHMQGTLQDWKLLQSRTHALVTALCSEDCATAWLASLDSVFDRLIAAYAHPECVDVEFWESMAKRGGTNGSGAHTYVNGWINVFFPYSAPKRLNPFCSAYSSGEEYTQMTKDWTGSKVLKQAGLDVLDFPDGLCSAPVMLDKNPLEFRGGFIGVERRDNCLTPAVGWFVACGVSKRTKYLVSEQVNQATFDANIMLLQNVARPVELEDFASQGNHDNAFELELDDDFT